MVCMCVGEGEKEGVEGGGKQVKRSCGGRSKARGWRGEDEDSGCIHGCERGCESSALAHAQWEQ